MHTSKSRSCLLIFMLHWLHQNRTLGASKWRQKWFALAPSHTHFWGNKFSFGCGGCYALCVLANWNTMHAAHTNAINYYYRSHSSNAEKRKYSSEEAVGVLYVCAFARSGERSEKVKKSVIGSSAMLWIMYFQYILWRFLIFYPNRSHHLMRHTRTQLHSLRTQCDSQFRLRTIESYWFYYLFPC